MNGTSQLTFDAVSEEGSATRQFLIYGQDKSLFALDLGSVREVLVLADRPVTPVPNTEPFLLGLTNLRGEIIAVADFGRFMGAEPVNHQQRESRIAIVEAPNPHDITFPPIRMGLAVDFVEGVLYLNPDKIVSAEEVSEEIAPFLRGLYDCDGRLLMIVDVEAIAQFSKW